MGDVLFTTPLLAALKAAYPSSWLAVATSAGCAPVLLDNPQVDELIAVPPLIGLRGVRAVAAQLRAKGFDTALVPDRSPTLGLVVALAGIPRRAGLDSGRRGMLYTDRVRVRPGPTTLHEAAIYAQVGAAIGAPLPVGQGTEYHPPASAVTAMAHRVAVHGWASPLWVIHPGGGVNPGQTFTPKRWPPERFAALADGLRDAHGGTVLLVGAASDADAVRAVRAAMRGPSVDLTDALSLAELQALAYRARLYIGNDTGMTHLAHAAGVPTVAVFGPTSSIQYGLYGKEGMMAVGKAPWSPCWRDGRLACTCGTIRCMQSVTVAAVQDAAAQVLGDSL